MTDDAEAVDRLLQQMRAEWRGHDDRVALKQAEHDGWLRGFREAARTGRTHAWTLYLYGFVTGCGLGAFLMMLLLYVTRLHP